MGHTVIILFCIMKISNFKLLTVELCCSFQILEGQKLHPKRNKSKCKAAAETPALHSVFTSNIASYVPDIKFKALYGHAPVLRTADDCPLVWGRGEACQITWPEEEHLQCCAGQSQYSASNEPRMTKIMYLKKIR